MGRGALKTGNLWQCWHPCPLLPLLLLVQVGAALERGRQRVLQEGCQVLGCLLEERAARVGAPLRARTGPPGRGPCLRSPPRRAACAGAACRHSAAAPRASSPGGTPRSSVGEGFEADVTSVGANACPTAVPALPLASQPRS